MVEKLRASIFTTRVIYLLLGCCCCLIWTGVGRGERAVTQLPLGAILFALASAAMFVAAVKPKSMAAWFVSLASFVLAAIWRVTALLIVNARDGSVYGRDGLVIAAIGVYGAVTIMAYVVWLYVLRPGGPDAR